MKKSVMILLISCILFVGCAATFFPSGHGVAETVPVDSTKQAFKAPEDLYFYENLLNRQDELNNESYRMEETEPVKIPGSLIPL